MKSMFEQMGGTYRREGDYLIPNLALPTSETIRSANTAYAPPLSERTPKDTLHKPADVRQFALSFG